MDKKRAYKVILEIEKYEKLERKNLESIFFNPKFREAFPYTDEEIGLIVEQLIYERVTAIKKNFDRYVKKRKLKA